MTDDRRLTVPPAALPTVSAAAPWYAVVTVFLQSAVDSPHTQRAYARALADAFAVLGVTTMDEIRGADLAAHRARLQASGKGAATVGQQLAALRSLLKWARSMGFHDIPADVIAAALRTPSAKVVRPYSVLSEREIAAMLTVTTNARDRALLAVLLGAGLRAAEAVGLDVRDLREDGEGGTVLHVRQGKGRKDRVVPVQADVARYVRDYLAASGRTLAADGPLFRAHDHGATKRTRPRLSTRSVAYIVQGAAERAGVMAKTISPHSLRHSYAIRALRRGGNVVAVSKLLGHASVSTTSRYLDHLALDELRATVPPLPLTAP